MNMLTLLLLCALIFIVLQYTEQVDKENFAVPYRYGYRGPCGRGACRGRANWWYNDFTPFVWGNATRLPKWHYAPYAYLHSYYDGWF